MVSEGGNGRKKNRARNKKKNNKNQQATSPSTNQAPSTSNAATSDDPTEFVPPPVAAVLPVVSPQEEEAPEKPPKHQRKKSAEAEEKCGGVDALAKNLIDDDDFVAKSYSLSSLQDAESSFYSYMEKSGSKQAKSDEEELDLFASDEEGATTEKPKMVKPAPKRKGAAKDGKSSSVKSSETMSQEYSNPANGERSFIMLKPDAVQRNLIGEIVERFEAKGFKLIALKLMRASPALLKEHYGDLSKKPFFPDLVSYMSSGPVVPMVWEGLNVVKSCRDLLGATNPADSAPGTIRGDYCIDIGRNIIHGSDSVEAAKKEISLWFKSNELTLWRSCALSWIYEDESPTGQAPISTTSSNSSSLSAEIARARQHIKSSLEYVDGLAALAGGSDVSGKIAKLESDNAKLHKAVNDLKNVVLTLQDKVAVLEKTCGTSCAAAPSAAAAKKADEDEDDDVDLFGSDSDEEEDAEKVRIREERLKAYHEKKAKKPALIAKTSVLLDVKPWDDETDMDAMLASCKTIQKEGLVWGASKLVPIGYGIKKLQVMCVVEDEKVSIDELCEQIEGFEDFVQSVDVAAMSKI